MTNQIKNILSFEIEDRFHVESPDVEMPGQRSRIIPILIHLLDVLDEYKANATFFILGWVAQKFPEVVALIDARGHEVASHGFNHGTLAQTDRVEFADGLYKSRIILEDILSKQILGYKAAGGYERGSDLEMMKLTADAGYRYLFGRNMRPRVFQYNQAAPVKLDEGKSILVIPFSTTRKLGITSHFSEKLRVYPYWFIKRAITKLNRNSQRAAINIKIWEFDHNHKRPPGASYTDYSSFGNLGLMEEKLVGLLGQYDFTSFAGSFANELK